MPNMDGTAEIITRYLKARVPIIIVRSAENARALELIRGVAAQFKAMAFYRYSMVQGLFELSGQVPPSTIALSSVRWKCRCSIQFSQQRQLCLYGYR